MAPCGLRFGTVLVVDPHHFLHVPFIDAASLGCLTSLGVRCIILSVQCGAIEAEFQEMVRCGEIAEADPELVIRGDLPGKA